MEETKRIKKLKAELIKELPFFPNDKTTLTELEGQSLNGVLFHYLHWKTRIVPPRQRKVQIAPEVTSDKRWRTLKTGINGLLDKVRNGEDIYPYHSQKAHKKGYTPAQRVRDGEVDSWEDKDQLLNTLGFHHFHLDMNVQSTGLSNRSDDVLFAFVSRDNFHAIGIFDHDVFESVDNSGNMTSERKRMWSLHEKHATLGMEPGSVYMGNPITTSGHPFYLRRMADYYAHIIRENDLKLDDRLFVNSLYDQGGLSHPNKYNFEWRVDALDLGVFDKKANVLFNIHKGHM
ncbi:hypothetical protein L1D40_10245 [Shewanella insulae]|uniref:hypothetical protein n=1 Tax=Shewanella insulae TaxID=2681496 RepID=UPI001EFC94E7|nr:hypothetical protein [Shewanella insulae]MCG9714166.1 hypothetical protein [Shewanella insulae]MCG9755594.1 hypothetical protein [Shewanella insulae]